MQKHSRNDNLVAMSFVRLENLNDFIQPSTTCIKPLEKKTTGIVAKVNDVNLSDCLACSGCITSAESVLVQQQNHEELFRVINENKTLKNKRIVVSMSLQSVVSLANKFSMEVQETAERIASFLVSIGCDQVYDINLARHLALIESFKEFQQRKAENPSRLPIISSICPGWICYAEKTNGDLIIPHLSSVRSPQQIMGSLLKEIFSERECKSKNDIYHVTLMPCFDKKLEASRQDFKNFDESQDVDCVLTPVELEEILSDEGVGLLDFDPRKLDVLVEIGSTLDNPLTSHLGSVSGGYAENILLADLHLKSICDSDEAKLEYSVLKNCDFIEVNYKKELMLSGDGLEMNRSKIAIVNGFRNIQTVVQRLKRRALKYDYIEIMACPSGCINGGAQCRPKNGENQDSTVELTKQLYDRVPKVETGLSMDEKFNKNLYEKLNLKSEPKINQLLHTNFHSVPKTQNLTVSW